jgi:hypothetical protein
MEIKKSVATLQKIIKEGIGDRSNSFFAGEIGITREHFSRLMRKNSTNMPTVRILNTLGDKLPNTSREELYALFDIHVESSEATVRPQEFLGSLMSEVTDVIDKVLRTKRVFLSTDGFASLVEAGVTKRIKLVKVQTSKVKNAVYHEMWKILAETEDYVLSIFIVLKCIDNPSEGSVSIFEVIYSGSDMKKCGFSCLTKVKKPYSYMVEAKTKEVDEEHLETISTVVYGFGIYFDEVDIDLVEDFLTEYLGEEYDEQSLAREVATVLSDRTKLQFCHYKGLNREAIMLPVEEVSEMEQTMVANYAKLLGAKEYGFIHVILEEEIKKDRLYDTIK